MKVLVARCVPRDFGQLHGRRRLPRRRLRQGTVVIPLPFSNDRVRTEAHWLQSQKCSIRCGLAPSQFLPFRLEDEEIPVSIRKSFPSLSLRKGFTQAGLAHLCSMGDREARHAPKRSLKKVGQLDNLQHLRGFGLARCYRQMPNIRRQCRLLGRALPRASQTLENPTR
jgi:hypothetical protein